MTDMNVDSTSDEEEYFIKMTYLPDLENEQANSRSLHQDLQLAKDIIARQELKLASPSKQLDDLHEVIRSSIKAIDAASAALHKPHFYTYQ